MAGSTGAGGLGALGWSAVAAGVAAIGGGILFVTGVLDPLIKDPADPVPVEDAVPETPETNPEPESAAEETDEDLYVETSEAVGAETVDEPESEVTPVETTETSEQIEMPGQSESEESASAAERDQPESEGAADPETSDADEDTETVEGAPAAASETDGDDAGTADVAEPEASDEASATESADEPDAPSSSEAPVLTAPTFDVVRVEQDGTTVVAGTGTGGSRVSIFLDSEKLDEFEILSDGQFVSFLSLGTSTTPRVLTMQAQLGEAVVQAADSIILAPSPAQPLPVQVAEADVDIAKEAEEGIVSDSPTATEDPATDEPEAPESEGADQSSSGTETAAADVTSEAGDEIFNVAQEADAADVTSDLEPTVQTEPDGSTKEVASQQPAETAPTAPSSVAEPAPVTVIRAGEDGVEVIQSGQQAAPSDELQIALDAIVYSDAGDVQLSGRASPGSLVRAYVNNRAKVDTSVSDAGKWTTVLPDVEPGVYTLRLDELGADGSVLSRLETPFKREAPEILQPQQTESDASVVAESDAPDAPVSTPKVRVITVQQGDTLWAISQNRYGDGVQYVRVFEANADAIRNPDLIYPGQIFTLPE
ncbi:MAG: LysM peptidoglycan-binding domain-containing protein [Paracoccaceae bacterium]